MEIHRFFYSIVLLSLIFAFHHIRLEEEHTREK